MPPTNRHYREQLGRRPVTRDSKARDIGKPSQPDAATDGVSIAGSYCRLRVRNGASLVEAVEFVTSAIKFCREQSIRPLLVDVTGLSASVSVTLFDRFLLAEEWATEAKGDVDVAIVVRSHHIDPHKFGVKTAYHHGLRANVFESENDALAWLRAGDNEH